MRKLLVMGLASMLLSALAMATPQEAFETYKKAILDKEGEVAVSVVTESTIESYQNDLEAARYAPKDILMEFSALRRMGVLLLRHNIQPELLAEMDGRGAFVYAVNQGWIDEGGVIKQTVDDVTVFGDQASANAFSDGKKLPYRFLFERENGDWKFDLIPVLKSGEIAMQSLLRMIEMDENEFIFNMIEATSRRKVSETIWQPPFE